MVLITNIGKACKPGSPYIRYYFRTYFIYLFSKINLQRPGNIIGRPCPILLLCDFLCRFIGIAVYNKIPISFPHIHYGIVFIGKFHYFADNVLNFFGCDILRYIGCQLKEKLIAFFRISSAFWETSSICSMISEKCSRLYFMASVYFSILPNCLMASWAAFDSSSLIF